MPSFARDTSPPQIALADYVRDIADINKVYLPTVHKSYIYLRIGSGWCGTFRSLAHRSECCANCLMPPALPQRSMMASLVILIVMGIIGGTPEIRGVVVPIAFTMFLLGFLAFLYSKWVEQSAIRLGAVAVKRVLDDVVNPRYTSSPHAIRWTVRPHPLLCPSSQRQTCTAMSRPSRAPLQVTVQMKDKKSYHLGRTLLERPVVSVYLLRSEDASGTMRNWTLPDALTSGALLGVAPTATTTAK